MGINGASSARERLPSMTAHELLTIPDAKLQGVKDWAMHNRLSRLDEPELSLLCDLAQSGQVRRLAQKLIPDGNDRRGYIHNRLPEARKRCLDMSIEQIREAARACVTGSREQDIILTIFIERSRLELATFPIDRLRELCTDSSAIWPKNLIEEAFRAKAREVLRMMTTSQLRSLSDTAHEWPADIVKQIIDSRPLAPGSTAEDGWREQI